MSCAFKSVSQLAAGQMMIRFRLLVLADRRTLEQPSVAEVDQVELCDHTTAPLLLEPLPIAAVGHAFKLEIPEPLGPSSVGGHLLWVDFPLCTLVELG